MVSLVLTQNKYTPRIPPGRKNPPSTVSICLPTKNNNNNNYKISMSFTISDRLKVLEGKQFNVQTRDRSMYKGVPYIM